MRMASMTAGAFATGALGYTCSVGGESTDCVAYNADLRLKVETTGLLTYPDVSVACGEQRFLDEHEDTLLSPTLIVEVLSDATEAYDRGKKFENYRQISTCREYLLVGQTNHALINLSDSQRGYGPGKKRWG